MDLKQFQAYVRQFSAEHGCSDSLSTLGCVF